MNKSILIILTALLAFESNSQQQDLFDTRWYATEMVVDGNTIPIPVLPANQPEGCFVGIEMISDGNDGADIDIALCWACYSWVHTIDNSSFASGGNGCLLCMDCGPCNPDGTATICTQGFLNEFESKQFDFYEAFNTIFTYTITPLPGNHLELKIDKPNGDYIIYTTESTLPLEENEILTFSIVPNPASNILTLTGLKSEVGSVVIYTLSGNKLPIALKGNTYDVSHIASGLYFISVTSVDGKKGVQKFIKK